MNKLRKSLDNIIGLYIADFEEKHECSLEFWVSDDTTGIACFGDHFFNLSDIIYDVDNNCKSREIFRWQDHEVAKAMQNKLHSKGVNFKNYLMGVR